MAVNLEGTFLSCRAVLPQMLAQRPKGPGGWSQPRAALSTADTFLLPCLDETHIKVRLAASPLARWSLRHGGSVVTVASVQGLEVASDGASVYGCSKAGVVMLTKNLATECDSQSRDSTCSVVTAAHVSQDILSSFQRISLSWHSFPIFSALMPIVIDSLVGHCPSTAWTLQNHSANTYVRGAGRRAGRDTVQRHLPRFYRDRNDRRTSNWLGQPSAHCHAILGTCSALF